MGARKRPHEEHENHERWLVSYADFITLLFAFFAVLYATSQADLEKQQELQESIKQQFAGAQLFGGGGESGANPSSLREQLINAAIEKFPGSGASREEVQDHVERSIDKDMSKEEQKQAGLGVEHDTLGVRIQLASSRLFSEASAELTPESARALDKVGRLLKESGRKIIVEGHTDNEPIRTAQFPSNWELSAARAAKIVRYLAARHKIPQSKMTVVAYGDQKPVAPNTTTENRARNRRIEILIVTEK